MYFFRESVPPSALGDHEEKAAYSANTPDKTPPRTPRANFVGSPGPKIDHRALANDVYFHLQKMTKISHSSRLSYASSDTPIERDYGYLRNFPISTIGAEGKRPSMCLLSDHVRNSPESPANEELRFMVGKLSFENSIPYGVLDKIACDNLNSLFDSTVLGKFKLKNRSRTFSNWSEFSSKTKRSKTDACNPIALKISIGKNALRGKLNVENDSWGQYPTDFIAENYGWSSSEDGKLFTLLLNSVIEDLRFRRALAWEYSLTRHSPLLGKKQLRKVLELILPFVPNDYRYNAEDFIPLMGGRAPLRTMLRLESPSDPSGNLELVVVRCNSCGVPRQLTLTANSVKSSNGKRPQFGLPRAVRLATEELEIEHDRTDCVLR